MGNQDWNLEGIVYLWIMLVLLLNSVVYASFH